MNGLEGVKPGDVIVVDGVGWPYDYTVKRLTRTEIVTECGLRFKKKSGVRIGGLRFGVRAIARIPTRDDKKSIATGELCRKIRQANYSHLTLDQLKLINAIMEEK